MNNFETGVAVGYLLHKGTNANLTDVTFVDNDTYTPTAPIDGWNSVTVNVPTYKQQYEELEAICDEVQDAVIENWPPDGPNPPTKPIPPEDIPELIGQLPGYTFPPGTNPTDPTYNPMVGGNPITDETLGLTVTPVIYDHTASEWIDATTTRIEKPPNTSAMFGLKATDSLGNVAYSGGTDFGLSTDGEYLEFLGYSISSGTVTLSYKYHVQTWSGWDDRYPTDTYQWAAVSTFGDTSHTYRVKNQ